LAILLHGVTAPFWVCHLQWTQEENRRKEDQKEDG